MNYRGSTLMCLALIMFGAGCATTTKPSADQVVAELSRRSGMPRANLDPLLANCDADQQSMYFCAYRDSVAADLTLKLVVTDRQRESSGCKALIARMIVGFERTRDAQCAKAAAEDYGGGSMEPMAQATCAAASTKDMIEQVQHAKCP